MLGCMQMEKVCIKNYGRSKAQTLFTGDVSISGGVTLTVDIYGTSPQFALTCISTGGPAATVAWIRDSTPVTEGSETVLQNPFTAEYLHTLKVTAGDVIERYTCTVANNKPSNASATIECEAACILAGIFCYCIYFPQILASQALFLWQNLPPLLT